MSPIYIICAILWGSVVYRHGAFKAGLPLSYRLQLITLSFLFVWMGVSGIRLFWWSVFHPIQFPKYFYVQTGIFTPLANSSIVILSCLISHLILCLGYWLAQQKTKVFLWGRFSAPYLFLISYLDYARSVQKHDDGTPKIYIIYGVGFCLIAGIYIWLYVFCRNEKHIQTMNSNKVEPSGPANLATLGG